MEHFKVELYKPLATIGFAPGAKLVFMDIKLMFYSLCTQRFITVIVFGRGRVPPSRNIIMQCLGADGGNMFHFHHSGSLHRSLFPAQR